MTNRNSSLSRLSSIQLQQRLIHMESELEKYKRKVKRYREDYYYNLIDELKEKNDQLEEKLSYYLDLETFVSELTKERDGLKTKLEDALTVKEKPMEGKSPEGENVAEQVEEAPFSMLSKAKSYRYNPKEDVQMAETNDAEMGWFIRSVKERKEKR